MSLFLLQLRGELTKLFARKRTYIGFGAFVLVEVLVLCLLNLRGPREHFRKLIEDNGYGFDTYFSGSTLGLLMLMWTVFLLGALYLALVSGDMIAKEVEDGTMRLTMCRPISRVRILALKYVACLIYTVVLTLFIGVTALIAGTIDRGIGGLLAIAPLQGIFALHETAPGLERFFGSLPLLALSLSTITSLGFVLSCFNMKPAAATIGTLSYMFLDSIFRNIPYFESLKAWFLTTHMEVWLQVFVIPIPTARILEDCTYLVAINATMFAVALAVFQQRDFKG